MAARGVVIRSASGLALPVGRILNCRVTRRNPYPYPNPPACRWVREPVRLAAGRKAARPYGDHVQSGGDAPGATVRELPPMPAPAAIPPATGTRQRTALRAREDFLGPGRLIAAILDYDLPFIPVVTASPPIRIGMCAPLSWSAPRAYGREWRSPETEAVDVAPAEPGTLLPGGVPPPTAPTW